MKKLAIAGASVALAAMPVLGVFADTTSLQDNISVTIDASCTFNEAVGKSYTDSSVAVGTQAGFNDDGQHAFNVFCNDRGGWTVSATAPGALHDTTQTGTTHDFVYQNSAITAATAEGKWSAAVDGTGVASVTYIPTAGGAIAGTASETTAAGADFTVTYDAWAGTQSIVGTYSGTVTYTLAHPASS